jgi:general secretion pathway protein D
VYVEAAIIEMSLQKQRELGFEFLYAPQQIQSGPGAPITPLGGTNFGNIGNVVVGGPAAFGSMNGLAIGAIKGTFRYNGQDFLNIGALLRALQTDGDVNVLSTPNILTTDNQKAEIMVGQNVPFTVGQTQNATTGVSSVFQQIERKDVGIKLAITPQISSDDNVRLEINQEISDVVAASALNSAGLITNKRSATTTVVVKDRETMVIGGLIRDNVTSSESKVPFLGDIPILGWLFKYKTTRVEKTNLMIFITPYIIKNEHDAEEITRRKSEVMEEFRKEYRIEEKKGTEPFMSHKPSGSAETSAPSETGAVTTAPTGTTPVPEPSTVPAKDQR